jgi:hypothetical protein
VLNEAANSFNVPTVPGYWLWPNFPLFLIAGCSPVENYKIQMVI